jgi:hypothetical protein
VLSTGNLFAQVNIPLMRQNEVLNGVAIYDREGNQACSSQIAARTGISQV